MESHHRSRRSCPGTAQVVGSLQSALAKSQSDHRDDILSVSQKLARITSFSPRELIEMAGGMVPNQDVRQPLYEAPTGYGAPNDRQILNEVGRTRQFLDSATDYAAQVVASQAYSNPDGAMGRLMEFERASAASQMRTHSAPGAAWTVAPSTRTTSSGKGIVRYEVSGRHTKLNEQFRHREVAEMVAAALNQTGGNMDDPRIARIRDLCSEEDRLVTEMNNQKRLLEQVSPENAKRHGTHRVRFDEAKAALLSVRRRLGIA
jgi:hypothetical protein